jgi:hypothetical protein
MKAALFALRLNELLGAALIESDGTKHLLSAETFVAQAL